ncbi:MAG: N-acetylmuramoyl-L-alanine amidase [Deltaproteobacteria bacterium]|nr:MAG: N-acetylmuramoyl-L-alanine amidase [Deltaproteobacteria bacterium]
MKYWSNPDYTRIALYTRTKVRYRVGRLPADRKRRKPERLYVDLVGCDLGEEVPARTSVKDGLVSSIRAAEKGPNTVRVVFDCGRPFTQKVVPLENPDRILVDISRVESAPQVAKARKRAGDSRTKAPDKRLVAKIKRASKPRVSLSVMAGLKIKRVVIDPGHGGRDPGAIGPSRTFEKKITLDIARRLKRLLSEKSGLEVLLTRNSDRFVPLEERTAFANEHRGDLFVSIHLNAHTNRKFHGVETFYLDITDDRYSIRLAARENATSEKTISDLRYILADLATKSNTDDAIHLARLVQRALVRRLRQGWKGIKSLGVKPALFYVLIGARMPAILVEASFITNSKEEKRLRRASYRQAIAEGIWRGIVSFIREREKFYASGR